MKRNILNVNKTKLKLRTSDQLLAYIDLCLG